MVEITLNQIIEDKKIEIDNYKRHLTIKQLEERIKKMPKPRDFGEALLKNGGINIIAEIKTKSPSSGGREIRENIDKIDLARKYEKSKATSIAVVTNKDYFGVDIEELPNIKKQTSKPILAKDFIIDEYQIYLLRAFDADAILLISPLFNDNLLSTFDLKRFVQIAKELNMDCLVECHKREDIEIVPEGVNIYGINHRDNFNGFKMDNGLTEKLIKYIPKDKIVVSESGIKTKEDVMKLAKLGEVKAVLVGTEIIKSLDPITTINDLLSGVS